MSTKGNITGRLLEQAAARPGKIAFAVLTDGTGAEQKISYAGLSARVQALAARPAIAALRGTCVLLVYEDVLEFIIAFLACQYAGIIAVPVACPNGRKRATRLNAIIADAGATTVLCTSDITAQLDELQAQFHLIAIDVEEDGEPRLPTHPRPHETAFIQYTSGSTGQPKGVVVSAANLWHNQQLLQKAFGCNPSSVILSWLPFHHDMGLIGNILHSIYTGCTCVLLSPLQFVQKPVRWLQAISKYRVTHSGGPNFAYNLCTERISADEMEGLDLSSWTVAYNGSEPIRQETVRRFSQQFAAVGFASNAFCPCYGLAEATLLVSAHKRGTAAHALFFRRGLQADNRILPCDEQDPEAVAVVSSGIVAEGMDVRLISVNGQACGELEEGEICIAGESVTEGYWNRDNTNYFHHLDGRPFLRTGDLGFTLNNELYVHGRLKEMLIVRGRNFYPHDMEEAIANAGEAIEANGVAVFSKAALDEAFVVVAEIRRSHVRGLDAGAVFTQIEQEVTASFGISPYDIVLTTPMGIPRTTSGKLQRLHCRTLYATQGFTALASRRAMVTTAARQPDPALLEAVRNNPDHPNLKKYLAGLIAAKLPAGTALTLEDATQLADTGLDSLRMMELINTINHDLDTSIDAQKLFGAGTVEGLVKMMETILWLKNKQPFGSEITI